MNTDRHSAPAEAAMFVSSSGPATNDVSAQGSFLVRYSRSQSLTSKKMIFIPARIFIVGTRHAAPLRYDNIHQLVRHDHAFHHALAVEPLRDPRVGQRLPGQCVFAQPG